MKQEKTAVYCDGNSPQSFFGKKAKKSLTKCGVSVNILKRFGAA